MESRNARILVCDLLEAYHLHGIHDMQEPSVSNDAEQSTTNPDMRFANKAAKKKAGV